MRVKYFEDTDTLYVELCDAGVIETKELSENLYVDLDGEGRVVRLTIEHVKATSGRFDFSYETVTV